MLAKIRHFVTLVDILDGKRYYQVKWRDSWEPEERLMAACEGALQTFWKEYYTNVEKEIRKQVVSASKVFINNTILTKEKGETSLEILTSSEPELPIVDISAVATASIPMTQETALPKLSSPETQTMTINVQNTREKVTDNFPEQSSTVAYYAVQDNENIENDQTEAEQQEMTLNDQADILKQIINATSGLTTGKWEDENKINETDGRRTLNTITADTLNTKNVSGPDSNSKFHCDICMKAFVSKRNVQRHMLSHTGEKPWMCEFCFKRFRQKPHLEQHVNIHKGIKNAVCSVCNKAFNHRSNLVTHMATHSDVRPHTCSLCGENFKLKHTLAKHMMVHTKQDTDKRHQCQICKRSFRDKSYLSEHETIHNKDKPWQCDICKKSFSFKRRYQMHLEVHQSKDGGQEYVCHMCPKKFKGKIYLQKHLQRHENKRRKRKKKIKLELKEDSVDGTAFLVKNTVQDEINADDDVPDDEEDDIDLTMSEVDVKAEYEIEEGEKLDNEDHVNSDSIDVGDDGSRPLHIDPSEDHDDSMVVASMLPMNAINMEDATYVALAQLTQAAIESSPINESVILMSYEDIQKSMENLETQQQTRDMQYDIQASNEQAEQQSRSIQYDIQVSSKQNEQSRSIQYGLQVPNEQAEQQSGSMEYDIPAPNEQAEQQQRGIPFNIEVSNVQPDSVKAQQSRDSQYDIQARDEAAENVNMHQSRDIQYDTQISNRQTEMQQQPHDIQYHVQLSQAESLQQHADIQYAVQVDPKTNQKPGERIKRMIDNEKLLANECSSLRGTIEIDSANSIQVSVAESNSTDADTNENSISLERG